MTTPTAAGSVRRWSLRARMTLWFAVTSASLVMVLAALSILVIRRSIEHQLQSLFTRAFGELESHLPPGELTPADFDAILADVQLQYGRNPMALRVWKGTSDELFGEFGALEMLGRVDAPLGRDLASESFGQSLRWRTYSSDRGFELGMLLDGDHQLARARSYTSKALAFIPISALLATIASMLLGRRIARMLDRIAAGVRDIRDPSEAEAFYVADLPDEVRPVADALREMLDHIHEEADAARFMTSGLAHELRSPIQNLIGETQVALLKERDGAEYRQVLESLHEEMRELARAVDNLVTLCATGDGARSRGSERFDLGEEASLRLERERNQAQRKGVQFALSLEGDLELTGNREALLLAVGNVATNAIQWTNAGGRVRIAFEGRASEVLITVEDEGPGIPAEQREEVFLPFKRTTTVAGGRRQGYGLGLALTRRAIDAHGGQIEIDSAQGGGARVRITLPR